MERIKAGVKEKSLDGLNDPDQNTVIINIICKYFIRDGKKCNMKFMCSVSQNLGAPVGDPVFDGVGLAGFKSRANALLFA